MANFEFFFILPNLAVEEFREIFFYTLSAIIVKHASSKSGTKWGGEVKDAYLIAKKTAPTFQIFVI